MRGISVRRIPEGLPGAGIAVTRIHYSADPTMTAARVAAMRAKYTSVARFEREMEISYESLEGTLLFPEFNEAVNLCEPFDVSDRAHWTIYHACDPHGRTPHAFLWEACSDEGEKVICGSYWASQSFTVREYAEVIHWIESDSDDKPVFFQWANGKKLTVQLRVLDTHGSAIRSEMGEDYFDSYAQHDIHYVPAVKGSAALEKARDTISEALIAQPFMIGDTRVLTPKLRIFDGCNDELVDEFKNVRYPEGEPERLSDERPKTYRKHVLDCIAEGTLILTKRGEVPIEEVKPGDLAMTRQGWRKVTATWLVGERPVWQLEAGGHSLTGTADHRVWTQNRGWVGLANLMQCDILYVLRMFALKRQCGTEAKQGLSFTERCLRRFGKPEKPSDTYAATAENLSGVGTIARLGCAPITAGRMHAKPQGLITRLADVLCAKRFLALTSTSIPRPAPENVVLNYAPRYTGTALVYDLAVEGTHEFYANGILVHNCAIYLASARIEYVSPVRKDDSFKPMYPQIGY